jgi:hypothetical protein
MDWFVTYEGGFSIEWAAAADCDLSVMYSGDKGWSWLIRRNGVDIAEGTAGSVYEAREDAEAAALRLEDDAEREAMRAGDPRRKTIYDVDFSVR